MKLWQNRGMIKILIYNQYFLLGISGVDHLSLSALHGQTEYILSYFLHGSILCLGIYMSVIKPSICFSKRVISVKWRNKLLIHNINLIVHAVCGS